MLSEQVADAENRRMAYNVVRTQLNNLKNSDALEVIRPVWKYGQLDVTAPREEMFARADAVAFIVLELVDELRAELNEKQRNDVGL